jgi:hypothetical protein
VAIKQCDYIKGISSNELAFDYVGITSGHSDRSAYPPLSRENRPSQGRRAVGMGLMFSGMSFCNFDRSANKETVSSAALLAPK